MSKFIEMGINNTIEYFSIKNVSDHGAFHKEEQSSFLTTIILTRVERLVSFSASVRSVLSAAHTSVCFATTTGHGNTLVIDN